MTDSALTLCAGIGGDENEWGDGFFLELSRIVCG